MTTTKYLPGVPRASLLARILHRDEPAAAPTSPLPDVPPLVPPRVGVETEEAGRGVAEAGRLYLEARRQIKRRAWGHAQRALEAASNGDPESPVALDLRSVRLVRRALRRASRWPSDPDAHLDLGRAYFDLDLGDDALAEFLLAQRLAPRRHEGYALATLEYLYRGEYAVALTAWSRARQLNPELPELDEVMGSLPLK